MSAKGQHNTGNLLVDGNLVVRDLTLQGSTFEKDLQVDDSTLLNGALDVLGGLSTLNEVTVVVNNAQLGGGVEVRAYNFDAVGAPHSVTLAMSQQILFFNNVAGSLYNFALPPASTARGRKFRFIADGTLAGANVDFVAAGGDTINGVVLNPVGVAVVPIAAAIVSATSNCGPTDWIELTSDGVGRWYLTGLSTSVGAFI